MVKSSIFKTFVIVISMLFICVNLKSQIIINEVCPLNHKSLLDDDHSNEDWIELYNPTDTAVNLKGYRISDKNDFDKAWIFPDTTILPQQFLTIFASGKDRYTDDKFIMETSGAGLYYWVNPEGYSFAYHEYEGDFEAKVRIVNFQNADFWANAGIMVREGLDNSSRFISIVSRNIIEPNDIFVKYRDTINNRIKRLVIYNNNETAYPDVFLKMNRTKNTFIMDLTDIVGNPILSDTLELNLKNKIFLGLQANSKNISFYAKVIFQNFLINNEKVNYENLKFYEVNTGIKGKFYKNNVLHTNFKLNHLSEYVYLWNNNRVTKDSIFFENLITDISFSRNNLNLDSLKYGYTFPTPSKQNSQLYLGISSKPNISFDNNFFNDEISIRINNPKNDIIRFNLNSNDPDTNSFEVNEKQFVFYENTVLKVRNYENGKLPSEIVTHCFFKNYNIKLPIISLTFDESILNDEKGLFRNVSNNETTVCNMEFFKNNERVMNSKIGIKLHGGFSRNLNQRAFRLISEEIYGDKIFDKKLLNNLINYEFDRVVLQNSGQDYFSTKMKDIYVHRLIQNMEFIDNLKGDFVQTYINGNYFGIYNIRERFDDDFINKIYNNNKSEINILYDSGYVKKGNYSIYSKKYKEIFGLDTIKSVRFEILNNIIKIDNFVDYMFINTFVSNLDFVKQNIIMWHDAKNELKFQPYDFDISLGMWGKVNDNYFYNFKANRHHLTDLFFKIMENDSVRNYFILRSLDKINTAFTTDSMLAIFNPMVDLIKEDIPQHQARFPESVPNWNESIDSIRYFLKERPNEYRIHLAEYFNLTYELRNVKINFDKVKINFNTITLDKSFEGKYFLNQKITLEVDYPKDENFLYWLVNNEKYSSDKKIEILVTEDLAIVPVFELKYNNVILEKFDIISYPNPTDGIVYIELGNIKDTFGTDIKVNIFDNNQKLMNTIHFDKNEIASLNNILSINLQNEVGSIISGVYYFQIIADEKVIYFDKVVLN